MHLCLVPHHPPPPPAKFSAKTLNGKTDLHYQATNHFRSAAAIAECPGQDTKCTRVASGQKIYVPAKSSAGHLHN